MKPQKKVLYGLLYINVTIKSTYTFLEYGVARISLGEDPDVIFA